MNVSSIPKILLLVDTSVVSGRKLIRGIAKYSFLYGPWFFNRHPMFNPYQRSSKILKAEAILLNQLEKFGANGVIANHVNNQEQFDRIAQMGIPMIVLGDYFPHNPPAQCIQVKSDSKAIGKLAAEHFLERGYENFAYCGYDHINWSQERGACYSNVLANNGFKTYFYTQPKSSISKHIAEKEQASLGKWLKTLPKPVGILTCNDVRAQQVIDTCLIEKIHLPEEIAVLGVDNDEFICNLSQPPLSSIPLDNEKAGFMASKILQEMMDNKTHFQKDIIVRANHVMSRQSTDILAIKDSEVALAIRFIRENSKNIIQVADVVNTVALSRRSLEERFKNILGRSIYGEITRCRIDIICQMLLETNLTISQIALELGYSSEAHISRYFKQIQHMTPLQYRKSHSL